MWGKVPRFTKCPRNDCVHYACGASETPCSACTCNVLRAVMYGEFRYQHRGDLPLKECRTDGAGGAGHGRQETEKTGV